MATNKSIGIGKKVVGTKLLFLPLLYNYPLPPFCTHDLAKILIN
ncbi:MAG: hypothetical protein ACTSO9_02585 [Candidatus Helarchaeota archaeon]